MIKIVYNKVVKQINDSCKFKCIENVIIEKNNVGASFRTKDGIVTEAPIILLGSFDKDTHKIIDNGGILVIPHSIERICKENKIGMTIFIASMFIVIKENLEKNIVPNHELLEKTMAMVDFMYGRTLEARW